MNQRQLTQKQLETVRLVAAGKVTYVRTGHGSWRYMGAQPTVVGALLRGLKLIEHGPLIVAGRDYYRLRLTDAGREVLERT